MNLLRSLILLYLVALLLRNLVKQLDAQPEDERTVPKIRRLKHLLEGIVTKRVPRKKDCKASELTEEQRLLLVIRQQYLDFLWDAWDNLHSKFPVNIVNLNKQKNCRDADYLSLLTRFAAQMRNFLFGQVDKLHYGGYEDAVKILDETGILFIHVCAS